MISIENKRNTHVGNIEHASVIASVVEANGRIDGENARIGAGHLPNVRIIVGVIGHD